MEAPQEEEPYLSPKQLRPLPTPSKSAQVHIQHKFEAHSTLFYLLYSVQCAVFKEHSNAQLHCALNSAVHSAEQGDGGVQCEAPVAGYHSHLSEGLR